MHADHLSTLLSAVIGSGLASFVAKLYISRSIAKMDEVVGRLEHLTTKFAVAESKLETLEKLKILVFEHDRKIVDFEARIKRNGANSGRMAQNSV